MIKINLALKKQAVSLDTKTKAGKPSIQFDPEAVKAILLDAKVRKIALAIIVAVLANYLLTSYENQQLGQLDQQIQVADAKERKVQAELAKTAGYDALKKQLDADEELIRTKLTTIQKLIADRQTAPKMLASLSSIIPKNVWITGLDVDDKTFKVKGDSIGFDEITDFLKNLGDSDFLSDVKLDNSEKEANSTLGLADFEIEAKRK